MRSVWEESGDAIEVAHRAPAPFGILARTIVVLATLLLEQLLNR